MLFLNFTFLSVFLSVFLSSIFVVDHVLPKSFLYLAKHA